MPGIADSGVRPDPAPNFWPWTPTCTKASEPSADDCIRREMKACAAKKWNLTGFNCCHCVEQALKVCGISLPPKYWPNFPVNPGPKPNELSGK